MKTSKEYRVLADKYADRAAKYFEEQRMGAANTSARISQSYANLAWVQADVESDIANYEQQKLFEPGVQWDITPPVLRVIPEELWSDDGQTVVNPEGRCGLCGEKIRLDVATGVYSYAEHLQFCKARKQPAHQESDPQDLIVGVETDPDVRGTIA